MAEIGVGRRVVCFCVCEFVSAYACSHKLSSELFPCHSYFCSRAGSERFLPSERSQRALAPSCVFDF